MKRAALHLLLILVLATSAAAITADAQIDPQTATTSTTLDCLVNATASGTLQANITWYKDASAHTSDNQTISLQSGTQNSTTEQGAVESSDTSKDESWTCQATVYNATNSTVVNSTAITIDNSAPTVTFPTSDQTATEGQQFLMTATATDPDGDPIVGWVSSDLNKSEYNDTELFEIKNDGTIDFTPTYDQRGNHTMALLASDGELLGGRNVLFTVNAVNQKPYFSPPLEDQDANSSAAWSYEVNGTDREGDEMNFTLVDSTLSTVRVTQTDNDTAVINLTTGAPRYEDRGLHNISVAVLDANNASSNTTTLFTLNITAQNAPPTLHAFSTPNGTQNQQYTLNVTANDTNTNDTLQFSVTSSCSLSNPWSITTTNSSPSNASGQINTTLTNDHVACRNITITVRDFEDGQPKDSDSTTVLLNLTNVNDAPTVHENSSSIGTYDQKNMSQLQAAQDVPFSYTVRATDPDSHTYEGEVLTYSDNTSVFNISSSNGQISFTPAAGDVGNHTINITATDDDGASHSRTMNLEVVANDAPVLQSVADAQCDEDSQCQATFSAFDDDAQENLTYALATVVENTTSGEDGNESWTLTQDTYNTTNATKTYLNDQVGSYQYNLTVTDKWGASDSQLWNVTVNNTNDQPILDQDQDGTADNVSIPEPVVVSFSTEFSVRATDDDLANNADTLTLNTTINGPNSNLFSPSKTSDDTWFVSFTPAEADIGDYSVNFTVTDQNGTSDTDVVNFTVYNVSQAPTIDEVQPYYNQSTGATVHNKTSTAGMNSSTDITLTEPNTYVFNATVSDADTAAENLTLYWYADGKSVKNASADSDTSWELDLDYFSQGNHTYELVVKDNRYSNATFTWNADVQNVNRPPQLLENFSDRNITQATAITDMMDAFYDPDDDTDSNGQIDGSETNNLTFSATSTDDSVLDITFDGLDVTLTPKKDGSVDVVYTAQDAQGADVDSNTVTYEVEKEEEESSSTTTTTSSGGGGGGSSSTPTPVPVRQDPEPETIQIIVPEPLTIYYNETVAAPLTITNSGERTLRTVTLTAATSAENVTMTYSENVIETIEQDEEYNVTLYVTNFRPEGTYEISVTAQAQEPDVNDTAILFVNSLEQTSMGDDVNTRITFARDLVSSNPECLELNELLSQATRAVQTGQEDEANRLINAAIEGCRYLISESNKQREDPSRISLEWFEQFRYANHVLIGLLVALLGVAGFLLVHYVSAAQTQHEEE